LDVVGHEDLHRGVLPGWRGAVQGELMSPSQAVHCLVPRAVTARRTEPTGAASTVATHLPVVAWSAALTSPWEGALASSGIGDWDAAVAGGVAAPRRRRAGTGGPRPGQGWEVFGMKVAVVPDPIAGIPMVVPMGRHHWDGTTR
jgi:hypothetical protein